MSVGSWQGLPGTRAGAKKSLGAGGQGEQDRSRHGEKKKKGTGSLHSFVQGIQSLLESGVSLVIDDCNDLERTRRSYLKVCNFYKIFGLKSIWKSF